MPETIEQLRAENERLKARITELETVARTVVAADAKTRGTHLESANWVLEACDALGVTLEGEAKNP